MHYKNGREAKVGDVIVGMTYNKSSVQVGSVVAIQASANPKEAQYCNVTLQLPSKTPWGAFEQDYSQCDWLLHAEDVWVFVIGIAFTPQEGHDYFAKVHNFAMKWNPIMAENRGLNAAALDD